MVLVNKPILCLPGELRCPRCFGKDIVPSLPRGWRDGVMEVFGRIPRHCRFCGRRFYVRWPGGKGGSGGPADQGEGTAP